MFHRCVSVQGEGEGWLPHLHRMILLLLPCPFVRVVTPSPSRNTSTGPKSLPGGGGFPVTGSSLGLYGIPPGQDSRIGWGTPPPTRTRRVAPPSQYWMECPPPPPDRLRLDRLCRGRYGSCGFPQEDFFA